MFHVLKSEICTSNETTNCTCIYHAITFSGQIRQEEIDRSHAKYEKMHAEF
jgi:hypothetical protein